MGALSASTSSVNWLVEDDILLKNAVEVTPACPPVPPTALLAVPTVRLDASIDASNVVLGLLPLKRDGFRGICAYRNTG
jgi:hypothetical protein